MGQVKIENAEIREAIERAKKDHAHEWHAYMSIAMCIAPDCGAELSHLEVERRLNATERLDAETARAIWRKVDALSQEHLGYEFSLIAYSSALAGDDEKS